MVNGRRQLRRLVGALAVLCALWGVVGFGATFHHHEHEGASGARHSCELCQAARSATPAAEPAALALRPLFAVERLLGDESSVPDARGQVRLPDPRSPPLFS
ncbi:MAG TPA: hypothetical protein PKG80_09840 [Acidobacteriota bacterium]|nr:hypothetical protein [Acidobacteriota bacterium]